MSVRPRTTKPPRARSSSVWDNVAGTGQEKREGKTIVKTMKETKQGSMHVP